MMENDIKRRTAKRQAVVVIPLLADYTAAKDLNPSVLQDGQQLVLATRLMAAMRRSCLHRAVSVANGVRDDH